MAEPLKYLFTPDFIEQVATELKRVWTAFPAEAFQQAVLSSGWDALELKARMRCITQALHQFLPADYPQAIALLNQVAPKFSGYTAVIFPDYVQCYGLDDWATSLPALHWMTRFSTAEFAVRPFLEQNPHAMLSVLHDWSEDENEHVRRLASEGCRPRLPWASELKLFRQDPEPLLPLLDRLKQDPSLYVRRSVANNLNDISKDHPQKVLAWVEPRLGQHADTDWLLRHACRTLLKRAEPAALNLFGWADAEHIQVSELVLSQQTIAIGETLAFSFSLKTNADELGRLRLEYIIEYMKANGQHRAKTFQIRAKEVRESQAVFSCQQSFREMTTRRHYPGLHRLHIRVNGSEKASCEFTLTS